MKIFGKNNKPHASQHHSARKPFHSVDIIPGLLACQKVQHYCARRYLADEAPVLPVSGCECAAACRCIYKHYDDRRTDLRRDSDHGLPNRAWQHERRSRGSRRITDKAG